MKKMFLSDRLFNNNKLSEAIYTLYLKLINEKHSAKVERTNIFLGDDDEEDKWGGTYWIQGFNITFENGSAIFVSDGSTIRFGEGNVIYHRSARRIRSVARDIYNVTCAIDNDVQEVNIAPKLLKHINGENNNG